ncbi:aconitate hydratase [Cupriavidus oxalaticus]|uniref:Aconitate hydratase n=1 Tax=Cupriavidus oxalaticus TaxID=96344 RepID=A0A375GPP5_9BURK|nr:aconitate hydratase [Cupriavidus oxalaticus]QRQ85589.1 aconitate hydratase [Cupriavidus oxalaticus]QRQ90323.1 aconitate hydratase [Cupriavidus oxalaticus]WQD84835.1 aconitate hydratase [Cupriavidus oxalaticus]SPC07740.1 Aconitate hydratase 1 protein [Cupriavidus oxalaticus]SPC24425.1 Aconitate hydratase 1 protein [Cupriavidus oxalaticus]
MGRNVAQKLIDAHLLEGDTRPGKEIALRIDQTLTQDATGTLVMLELEGMQLDRVKTELSVQYVDHNLLQEDFRNPDDHLFLYTACRRFGIWYSRAGNGVSHPTHMQYFGCPGKTLVGSDSHTCAAGSLGMLAFGAGGIEVAMAMAGEPFFLKMPEIWGITLIGELPSWVSAKDVILEMLRRYGVNGGTDRIIEYRGPGLIKLSAMDRHVIANMGAELGATTSVFPADEVVRRFLAAHARETDFANLLADENCQYDLEDQIDLSLLEPLIARPCSPGDVVPVREVAGEEIYQSYIGSSANPGYRDFAIAAQIVRGRMVAPHVSFDVNPTSRGLLEALVRDGHIGHLLHAGARLHQAGCNGCIGMGQAPATGKNSLRTVPRNFPGRSGTRDDLVWLCSPETAAASALAGRITDPRELEMDYPDIAEPGDSVIDWQNFVAPLLPEQARAETLVKGPNILSLPDFEPLPGQIRLPLLLKVGDDISTDDIMPAGAAVLPYRSNIPAISEFVYEPIDKSYVTRARAAGDHAIVGGLNYGQGSSREHAAIAPRYLGLRMVIARGFARIHWQNLVNFGILPLRFGDAADYDRLALGDVLVLEHLDTALATGTEIEASIANRGECLLLTHGLSPRQVAILRAGGLINWLRERS